MATDQGVSNVELKMQERTFRTVIETPYGADPFITIYRESVGVGPDGTVIFREEIQPMSRHLSSFADRPSVMGKETYTPAEVISVIVDPVADAWSREVIEAKKAERERLETMIADEARRKPLKR
jgi:hypothetical protein